MISKHGNIVFTSVVLALLQVGCGSEFTPPSDDEMLRHFAEHERELVKIVEELKECPYGNRYSPYDGYWSPSDLKDSLCQAYLGAEKCQLLDSLIKKAGVLKVDFNSPLSLWQVRNRNSDSIPPVEALPIQNDLTARMLYHAEGTSIGPSMSKEYLYDTSLDSLACKETDLDSLFATRHNPGVDYLSAERHIKGNWYISLFSDH